MDRMDRIWPNGNKVDRIGPKWTEQNSGLNKIEGDRMGPNKNELTD